MTVPVQAAEEGAINLFGESLIVDLFDLDPIRKKQINQQLQVEIKAFVGLSGEINQLNTQGYINNPSENLIELLHLCDQWEKKSESAFSCRLGGLQQYWQHAIEKSELPDRSEIRKKAREFLQQNWAISPSKIEFTDTTKNSDFKLNLDNFLQAFAVDKLVANITEFSAKQKIKLNAVQINLGIQQRCWNLENAVNNCVIKNVSPQIINLSAAKIVSFNNAIVVLDQRNDLQKIGPYKLGKILNPKDGWPSEFSPSVLVVAKDSVTATAVTYSLAVKPIAAGINWVESQQGVEALIKTDAVIIFTSKRWHSTVTSDTEERPLWAGDKQFLIEYQTQNLHLAEYQRPYVAIWITDNDRNSIRQLLVHGNNGRWLKEISLWWRSYGRNNESAFDGLARATLAPGSHTLTWDGRDDKGQRVPKGHYILHLEAAREHGDHEVVTLPFELSGESFTASASGQKELGAIKISFVQ